MRCQLITCILFQLTVLNGQTNNSTNVIDFNKYIEKSDLNMAKQVLDNWGQAGGPDTER
jgi:hypothetical protein